MSPTTPPRGGVTGGRTLLEVAMVRLDAAAVEELLAQAARLAGRVGQPKPSAGLTTEGAPAGRLAEVGSAPPTILPEVA